MRIHVLLLVLLAISMPLLAEEKPVNTDDLVGWYELPNQDRKTREVLPGTGTYIPVLKHGEKYYTVCRGAEARLEPCAEGLRWAMLPSSMEGTTIGHDPVTKQFYIRIVDAQLMHNDDWYDSREKRPLKRVDPPKDLPDATAPAPKSSDDFVGHYQVQYFPIRYELTRSEGKFGLIGRLWRGKDGWVASPWTGAVAEKELSPNAEELGFLVDERSGTRLRYNPDMRRYELVVTGKKKQGDDAKKQADNRQPLTMPLVRLDPAKADNAPLASIAGIGIPSWH